MPGGFPEVTKVRLIQSGAFEEQVGSPKILQGTRPLRFDLRLVAEVGLVKDSGWTSILSQLLVFIERLLGFGAQYQVCHYN